MKKNHFMKLHGYVLDKYATYHKSLVTYCEQLPIWNSSVCIPIGNWEVEVIFFIKKIRRIVNKNIKCHTRFDVHWFSINRQKSRPAFTSCWQATTKNAIRLLNDEFIMFSPICFREFFSVWAVEKPNKCIIHYWSKTFFSQFAVEKLS